MTSPSATIQIVDTLIAQMINYVIPRDKLQKVVDLSMLGLF